MSRWQRSRDASPFGAGALTTPRPSGSVAAMPNSLLVTVSGPDRPGVTARLFEAIADCSLTVLDVEQVVIHGRLVLGLLLDLGLPATDASCTEAEVTEAITGTAGRLGLVTSIERVPAPSGPIRDERTIVIVLGAPLQPRALAEVGDTVAACGGNIDGIFRVADHPVTALELEVAGADPDALRVALAGVAADHEIDLSVQRPGLHRRGTRLVVMDVDSTLIQDEVIELIANQAGCGNRVAQITDRAMRGEIDFATSLRERVALLAGAPVSILDDVRGKVRLTPGARTLCRTMTQLGFSLALVSGGFHEVIDPIAASLGIHAVRANRLEVEGGILTGGLSGPLIDRAGKATALEEFARAFGIPLERTVAVGDGANDLDMIAKAGLGIAFNAKPVVRAAADASVTAPYLDSVLYLLGIPREEIESSDG